jgi:hypothetical protein
MKRVLCATLSVKLSQPDTRAGTMHRAAIGFQNYACKAGSAHEVRSRSMREARCGGGSCAFVAFFVFLSSNHSASKLYSLWHIGYLLDAFYGLHICSRVHLLLYNPARRSASTEPPWLSGSTLSYFSVAVVLHHILTPRHSPPPLLPLRLSC